MRSQKAVTLGSRGDWYLAEGPQQTGRSFSLSNFSSSGLLSEWFDITFLTRMTSFESSCVDVKDLTLSRWFKEVTGNYSLEQIAKRTRQNSRRGSVVKACTIRRPAKVYSFRIISNVTSLGIVLFYKSCPASFLQISCKIACLLHLPSAPSQRIRSCLHL